MTYSIGDPEHPADSDPKFDDIDDALAVAHSDASYGDSIVAVWEDKSGEVLYLCFGGEVFSK